MVKMRSPFTLFLFCSLFCSSSFLFSCSGSVKEILSDDSSCKELVADLKSDEYEEIDKILSIEDYIKLETKENCFIGTISKLIVTDSEIIVIDKKIANSVYVFNKDGSFRTKISERGRGPQEYLVISDVFLINDDKEICITDFEHERIQVFDCYGKYLRTIKNMTWFRAMESLDSCTLIAFDECDFMKTGKSFVAIDYSNNIKYSFGNNIYSSIMTFGRYQNLYKFYDGVYGTVNFENTIYKFTSDSVYACYKISTIPQIINSSKFKDDKQFLDEENRMGLFNGELINTERFLMFRIHSNDYGDPLFVYDKYSEKITKVKLTLNNPINIFWNFPIACTKKGECYYAVSASKAINYKDFLYETYDDEQLLNKLYSSLSADSNPIICISSFICKDEK